MAPQETSSADDQLTVISGRAATIHATDMHRVSDAMIHTLVQSILCAHCSERAPQPPTRGGSSPPPEHYHTCGELQLDNTADG